MVRSEWKAVHAATRAMCFCLGMLPVIIASCGRGPIGDSGDATYMHAHASDVLLLETGNGFYVGTTDSPMQRKLKEGGRCWAFSSDVRFLAVGAELLDRSTGKWSAIPIDLPAGAGRIILRWAPDTPLLGISFCALMPPSGELPEDRSRYGFPFLTWDPIGKKLVKYENARIEYDFHWLSDGKSIMYSQGDCLSGRARSAALCSVYVYELASGVAERNDIRLAESQGMGLLPLTAYPVPLSRVHFDLGGARTGELGMPWMGPDACENPRTGDFVETLSSPDRMVVRQKNAEEGKTVAFFKRAPFRPVFGRTLSWYPRWLRDDHTVVILRDANLLTVVDARSGEAKTIAKGVSAYYLLDPDLYRMRRDRMTKNPAQEADLLSQL